MVYPIIDKNKLGTLFQDWNETLIWSCLENTMGAIYADKQEQPAAAMAILGDFCFFTGSPSTELVHYRPDDRENDFIIMVPRNPEWASLIEREYGDLAKKVTRYAIKKETGIFEREKLTKIADSLAKEYTVQAIDECLFDRCRESEWSKDLVSQYADYDAYQRLGLGVMVLRDGEPVSGASSYSSYPGGIEIEIDTKKEFRRQGLASVCGARLILECLERDLYPSWDAQNLWSVALAEKLGYHFDHEYPAYEVTWQVALDGKQ